MIYDCFPFLNELDLLEIRLMELAGVVDYFIITESLLDFRGRNKSLTFYENRNRFARWEKQIIHQIVPNPVQGSGQDKTWERDQQQRNYCYEGLKQAGAKDDDLIFSSDADEIPSKACFPSIEFCYREFIKDRSRPVHLSMRIFLYYFNLRWWLDWYCPVAFPFRLLHSRSAHELRHAPLARDEIAADGGWHFTYMGDADTVAQKCTSYAHWSEEGDKQMKDLKDGIASKVLRPDWVRRVMVDSTYPDHIYLNQSLWTKRGYIQA